MKAFLVTVSSLCLCGILLCFLAYVTGNFPFVPRTYDMPKPTQAQKGIMQTPSVVVETDPLCSPCVEKMAKILDIMSTEWEADMTAFLEQSVKPVEQEAHGWIWLSKEQRERAQQLFDQYGTEEGLRRLREMDPDAARHFESDKSRLGRERSTLPDHEMPSEIGISTQ